MSLHTEAEYTINASDSLVSIEKTNFSSIKRYLLLNNQKELTIIKLTVFLVIYILQFHNYLLIIDIIVCKVSSVRDTV